MSNSNISLGAFDAFRLHLLASKSSVFERHILGAIGDQLSWAQEVGSRDVWGHLTHVRCVTSVLERFCLVFSCVVFFTVHIKPPVYADIAFYLFHPFIHRQTRRGTIISSINYALLLTCPSLKPLNSVSGTPLNTAHFIQFGSKRFMTAKSDSCAEKKEIDLFC